MVIQKWSKLDLTRLILGIAGLLLIIAGVMVLISGSVNELLLYVISIWKGRPPAPNWLGKIHLLAIETLVIGTLLVILSWFVLPRWTSVTLLAQKQHILLVTAILALVALQLPVVLVGHSAKIDGERYWWLDDDPMISMRYARNLTNGIGLVWNLGERVEGYTNFLWTIYMSLVHLLPIHVSKTSLVILLTNVILASAIVPVIIRFVRVLGGGKLAIIGTLAGYVLSMNTMRWNTAGFETTLLTFLFLLAAYRVLKESQLNQPRLMTYLLIATMSLIRADAIVLSVMLYAVSFLLIKNRKMVLFYSIISLLIPFIHELFRLYYYGDILPNTAYLKTSNWNDRYLTGLIYILSFTKHYFFFILFAVAGSIQSRKRSQGSLLVVFILYMAYVAYVGGDVFAGFRFFVHVIPLLLALAFIGIQNLGLKRVPQMVISTLCLATMPLIYPGYIFALFPSSSDIGNIRIGLHLKHNTPTTSKVADFWAGSTFYFSERYAIDLLGKSDRYIAHMPVASNGTKPGHNKFDFDYSLGTLKPDFVVANFRLPVKEDDMRKSATGDYAFTGQLYFNPIFREHYLPNPLHVETWRTIFRGDWSSLENHRDE